MAIKSKSKSESILCKFFCALVCIGVFAFLAYRVSENVHPWEKVLKIDNGLGGDRLSASSMGERKVACFSPDEKTLFVATASGLIEAWDLVSLERKNVFGVKLDPDPDEEYPHLRGAWNIEVNDLGQIVESRWGRLLIHSMEGELIANHELDLHRKYGVSSDGEFIVGGTLKPKVTNLDTGAVLFPLPDIGLNGGNGRYQWSEDGKNLLISEASVFAIFDTETWKTETMVRTRYIDLVNEMKSELEEPVDKDRKWSAMLMDSQFVDGDRKVASIYNADSWNMSTVDPRENVLRFTDVESGELLNSVKLPYGPRSMWVDDEGKKIYVTMCPNFSTLLNIYDAETMGEIASVKSKVTNTFPTRGMALNGERNHILQYNGGAVMQDWDVSYVPVRFEPLRNEVIQVLANKESTMLVTVMNSREIHVWKKSREFSRWGAFVLWEYVASYLLMISLFLAPVYLLAKGDLGQKKRRPFRKFEWVVLIVSAISLAIALVRIIYQPLFGDTWLYYYEGFKYSAAFGLFIALTCFAGLLLQNDSWRKFNRFISLLGGLVMIGILIYLLVQISSIDADVYSMIIPDTSFDGLKWGLTVTAAFTLIFLSSCYLFFKCWVLRIPFEKKD